MVYITKPSCLVHSIYTLFRFKDCVMICKICNLVQAKYKCPKCSIQYCSSVCYKSASHALIDEAYDNNHNSTRDHDEPKVASPTKPEKLVDSKQRLYEVIAEDEQIKSLLKLKALQFHLSTIIQILGDERLTNDPTMEGRCDIAKKKLCNLRSGGFEENELVEEFVHRVLYLMSKPDLV